MVTGSMASSLYARPRMTRDIDLVVELSLANVEQVITLFQEDCYLDRETIRQEILRHGMFNIIDNKTIVKADFIVRKDDEYRRMEFSRRRVINVEGLDVCVVSPEDLILSKLAWAKSSESEMQLGDIKQLIQSVKTLEIAYLTKWAHFLHVDKLLAKVLNHA